MVQDKDSVRAERLKQSNAMWITADTNAFPSDGVAPAFWKSFSLKKKVSKAVLLITPHGLYELKRRMVSNGKYRFTSKVK